MKQKKVVSLFLMLMMLVAMLAGCSCRHEWQKADCKHPRTCVKCGVTEGEALGHEWAEADCEHPRTCAKCGVTEGEALGHEWVEATTDAPKTCKKCGKTEGERIITDPRFHTSKAAPLFGTWKGIAALKGQQIGIDGFNKNVNFEITLTFEKNGELKNETKLADEAAFKKDLIKYMEDSIYAQFAEQNMNKDQANSAVQQQYHMTVAEYAEKIVNEMDFSKISSVTVMMVYFVEDNAIMTGRSWGASMEAQTFRVEGDTLCVNIGGIEVRLDKIKD